MKLYMFRTVPPSIISSLTLYTQQWYMSYIIEGGSVINFVIKFMQHQCREENVFFLI